MYPQLSTSSHTGRNKRKNGYFTNTFLSPILYSYTVRCELNVDDLGTVFTPQTSSKAMLGVMGARNF